MSFMAPKPKEPNTPSNLTAMSTNLTPFPGASLSPLPQTPMPSYGFTQTPALSAGSSSGTDNNSLLQLLQGLGA